jgi:taurine dioxygenase
MLKVIPSGQSLGATIEGADLASLLSENEVATIMKNLGGHGVLRFPRQQLSGRQLRDFSARLGELEINVASGPYQEPGVPEVMILSNIVEGGKSLGLADAGQGWHTDMSYSKMIAFANVLYGIKIPRRDGKPLGATQFSNMHAAYEGLSREMKKDLEGKTALQLLKIIKRCKHRYAIAQKQYFASKSDQEKKVLDFYAAQLEKLRDRAESELETRVARNIQKEAV